MSPVLRAPWHLKIVDTDIQSDALPFDNSGDPHTDETPGLLFLNTDFESTAKRHAYINNRFRCMLDYCPQDFSTESNDWDGSHGKASRGELPCIWNLRV